MTCRTLSAAALTLTALLTLTGGCPMSADLAAPAVATDDLVAGVYWVEPVDGQLEYFDPGRERGQAPAWATAAEPDAGWFTGPGLYEYSNADGWQRLQGADATSADDLLQVHDPLPAVPDEIRR